MKKFIYLFLLCGCGLTQNEPVKAIPRYPDYLKTADAFVGYNEYADRGDLTTFLGVDPVQYEWCAAFVNSVLRVNDIEGSESVSDYPLTARSFLKWGIPADEPRMGDIVIFTRGTSGWQGHVGFYIRTTMIDGVKHYVVLGGNQDNSISYEAYPASRLLGFRRLPE